MQEERREGREGGRRGRPEKGRMIEREEGRRRARKIKRWKGRHERLEGREATLM